ncbi:MAG: AsmA family protein [Verrucomicrobia bacterium]|jgi:hypothetical protein|nr:AsmA family protein [Verrucomicrobiota bacterium]MBT7067012.1 AsmA family protein [Verrucomicrobiota bacterium]MBT7702181.1 AsmA family protein [Verrucomicrobiota bacterium]
MKKALKKVAKVLGTILLVLVVLVVVLLMVLPNVVVKVVNSKAGDFVNAEVSLTDIDLNLLRGYVEIEGLRVGQPEGFEGDDLLTLKHAHVKLDVGSLMNPPIIISDVRVDGLTANIIKDTNGVMNVEKLAKNPPEPKEEPEEEPGPAGDPIAVALEKLVVNDVDLRYRDASVGDEPLVVGVDDLLLMVNDILFDPAAPVDRVMPGRVELTTRIHQGDAADAHLGAIARLGVLGTNVPAVNAGVRLAGIEIKGYKAVLPTGMGTSIAAVLGGSCLDLEADVSMAAAMRDIEAALVTKGARLKLPVESGFGNIMGDLSKLLAARLAGQTVAMAGNVGSAGVEVAGTAVKSAGAAAKGAGKIVGNVGGGLFKIVKGAATGDLKGIGQGLKDTTVGTVSEAVNTVTDTAMTAVDGVGKAASKGIGKDSADEWRDGARTRWEGNWATTVEVVDNMPYPGPSTSLSEAKDEAESKADAEPEPEAEPEAEPEDAADAEPPAEEEASTPEAPEAEAAEADAPAVEEPEAAAE